MMVKHVRSRKPGIVVGVLLALGILAVSASSGAAPTPTTGDRAVALSDTPVAASNAWQSYVLGDDAATAQPVAATVLSGTVTNPQGVVTGNGVTTLTNTAGQAPPILQLDYGKEVGGLPFFNVSTVAPTAPATSVTMRAGYSELQRYLLSGPPSTTLVVPASAGANNVNVASVTSFNVGGPLTIDTGGAQESATITAVGTAAGAAGTTTAATAAGATNVRVSSVAGYAPGQKLLIDTGANAEQATVSSVGTASASTTIPANSTSLAVTSTTTTGPSAAGDSSVNVASLTGFGAGMTVGLDAGAGAETATIASTATTGLPVPLYPATPNAPVANWVWNTSGATTNANGPVYLRKDFTVADPSQVSVAALRVNADDSANVFVNGSSLGQTTTGNNGWRTSMLVDIKPYLVAGNNVVAIQGQNGGGGADAGSVISALELYANGTLTTRYVTDTSWKALAGTPATGPAGWTTAGFDDSSWGNAVISGAYGVAPWNTNVTTPASTATNTITFTAPLTKAHATGTILGSITAAGATNIKVASVTGFSAGQQITIDTGTSRESATIASVGTAGAGGTGITLTAPTTNAHNGAVLVDAVVAPAGATNVKVASVTGFAVGDTMLVDTGAAQETKTVTAVGTAGAGGTGITFTPALAALHPGGTAVVDLGSGITVSTPFTLAHAAGVPIRGLGTGITFTPALAQAHAAGTTVTTTSTTVAGDANGNNGVGTDGSRADNFTLTAASGGTTVGNAVNLVQGGERFQAITLTTPGTVVLSGVGIAIKHYNQGAGSYQGYFLSNDDTLNRIWYQGVYTDQTDSILPGGVCSNATTCSQSSTILDGAKRDRRPWSGDLTTENRTMFASLGYGPGASEVIKNTLGQFGSSPQANGPICGQISNWINYPTSGVSCSFYSPTYSMYWSRGLQQYYLYSGDIAFAEAQYQHMKNELAFDRNSWNATTGLTNADGRDWDFYDGSKCGAGCAAAATNMLYYDDLAGAAWLAQQLAQNDPTNANASTWTADAATWSQQAADLKTAINSQLFNAGKGVYQLSTADFGAHAATSVPQDANSQAIVFGVAPSDKVSGILAYLKSNLWGTFGPQPYSPDAAFATTISPFISGFELDARFTSGDTAGALALTRLMWAQMADPNGPFYTGTLWERLGQNGNVESSNASQAHGWASAPVFAFTDYLLGVKPTSPGFKTWTIAPQTGDLSWAQGNVPVPGADPISSRWQMDDAGKTFVLTMSAPTGTTGTVSLPELGASPTIARDGVVVWAGGAARNGASATEVNGRVVFSNVTGGSTFAEVLDNLAPTTTESQMPATPDGQNGWYVGPVKVTLTAADDAGGSGVASTSYRIDGGPWQTYTAPITITADGTHTVDYYSTDNAGNTEATHTLTIKIDATKPVITYTGNAGSYSPFQTVSIQCSAVDPSPGSGIDPAATSCADVSGPAYSFGLGSHTYSATAKDLAGNSSSASTTFTVTTAGCLTSSNGPLNVNAGQSVCIAPGAVVTGPVSVKAGGTLYADGASFTGPVRATGAALVRLCGTTISGPLSVDGSTGIVVVGGDAATGPCAGNTITGPVTLTSNTAGVEFNGNNVTGPLTITGNTGSLPPPDTGPVHASGNTVTGPVKVQP
jgi:hypothetical protein